MEKIFCVLSSLHIFTHFENGFKKQFVCTEFFPISVPILIFLFVKRGDNRNVSSASKQKWHQNKTKQKQIVRTSNYAFIVFQI
jgi:hypothetical protein